MSGHKSEIYLLDPIERNALRTLKLKKRYIFEPYNLWTTLQTQIPMLARRFCLSIADQVGCTAREFAVGAWVIGFLFPCLH